MRRGQAFEVFRLLIAAVIAGAILMVLLNILGGVGITTQDPQDFVTQAVKSLASDGGVKTSNVIVFSKGMAFSLEAAASAAVLDTSCVHWDGAEIGSFEESSDGIVEYTGSTKLKAKIRVVCTPSTGGTCPVDCKVKVIKP